jgi:hypothetical protein
MAGTVVLVAAGVGFILRLPPRDDASHLTDTAASTQSQLKQQPEDVAREPVVNHEPAPTPTHEPIADVDTRAQPADPRPKTYNSLPTGTRLQEDVGTNGHGELTVKNGTTEDAVVRLSDAGTYGTMRWFFVRAQTSAQVAQIPEGTYRLAFTTGLNWVEPEETFSWHPSYSKFERLLTYSEEQDTEGIRYHSISVTLHTVPLGNVKTRSISREEFLRGHRHMMLQRPGDSR